MGDTQQAEAAEPADSAVLPLWAIPPVAVIVGMLAEGVESLIDGDSFLIRDGLDHGLTAGLTFTLMWLWALLRPRWRWRPLDRWRWP